MTSLQTRSNNCLCFYVSVWNGQISLHAGKGHFGYQIPLTVPRRYNYNLELPRWQWFKRMHKIGTCDFYQCLLTLHQYEDNFLHHSQFFTEIWNFWFQVEERPTSLILIVSLACTAQTMYPVVDFNRICNKFLHGSRIRVLDIWYDFWTSRVGEISLTLLVSLFHVIVYGIVPRPQLLLLCSCRRVASELCFQMRRFSLQILRYWEQRMEKDVSG